MKITIDNSIKTKEFRDVNVGDVFMFERNVYIRIPLVNPIDNRSKHANAIDLRDGRLHYITDTEPVTIHKSELIVKEEIH